MKRVKVSKRIEPRVSDRIGIINPYGQFWTDDTFDTPEQAEQHVRDFWHRTKGADITKFSYVPVVVTIAAVEFPARQAEPIKFGAKP